MTERLNVRIGNPVRLLFWSIAMLLTGIVIGGYWHSSRAHSVVIAIAAGVFTMVHELLCCFGWCSM